MKMTAMALRLLGLAAALVLMVATVHHAEAKMPSYVLTGGELGQYAAYVTGPIPDEDHPWSGWLPSENDKPVAQPAELPPLVYDVYGSYANAGIPYQMATGGPDLRYYPELHLLHDRRSDGWYELAPEAVAFLDTAIDDALAKKARGELEVGPIAADLRGRHLTEVTFWLRPTSLAGVGSGLVPELSSCRECIVLQTSSEEFIMRDVLGTMSGLPERAAAELPAFVIEFGGIVLPPYGGIGGVLGYYTPPSADRSGRFWPEGFGSDTLFFETTPGFDAAIQEALAPTGTPSDVSALDNGSAISRTTAVWGGLAAAAAGALVAGSGVLYARRAHLRRAR